MSLKSRPHRKRENSVVSFKYYNSYEKPHFSTKFASVKHFIYSSLDLIESVTRDFSQATRRVFRLSRTF